MVTFHLIREEIEASEQINTQKLFFQQLIEFVTRETSGNNIKFSKDLRSGGGNIRPAGHIRPAKSNFFSFDFAFLTEMWPATH